MLDVLKNTELAKRDAHPDREASLSSMSFVSVAETAKT